MKAKKIIVSIFFILFVSSIYAQKSIDGIYTWDMSEFLKISKDSFKLYLYPTEPFLYGLEINDTILSEGTVKYESDNFIQLTSKDYNREVEKNMTVVEYMDTCSKDSLRFKFIFPFDGHFKITLYIDREAEFLHGAKYEFSNAGEFVVPKQIEGNFNFSFIILNQTLPRYNHRDYRKMREFRAYPFLSVLKDKSTNSNSFEIFIPDLTNSYFNRRIINGEYAKISTCTGGMKCIILGIQK
jgi:hypothetical protein